VAFVGWLELAHHGFEKFFDFIGGECTVGLIDWWYIVIAVFVLCLLVRVLSENGHLIDEVLKCL
jgi:hypothetical protein